MTHLLRLFALIGSMLMAACGGGGGFSGTPNGPSAELRVFPPVSAVTVPVGYSYATVEIQGGRGPYVAMSSASAVGAVVVDGNKLQLTGYGAGTSEVAVVDQERATVKIQVTAVLIPMKSTIGSDVAIGPKQTISFGITGGVGPYKVRSSDTRIFTVTPSQQSSFGPFVLIGVNEGSGKITVTDSTDTDFEITVTVKAIPIVVTPAAVTGKAGTTTSLVITGGQAPFTVRVLDSTVAEGSVAGDALTVTLKKKGATKLLLQDSQGGVLSVDVTVDDSSLVIAPATASTICNTPATFRLTGGVAPYTALVSRQDLVTTAIVASSDGATSTLTATVGNTTGLTAAVPVVITVYDQTGSSREATLTITPRLGGGAC